MISPHRLTLLLSLFVLSFADGAVAASLNSASSTVFTVPNGTFETPALPASPGYLYAPSGTGWTLVNGAGLSRDATAFTSGNPNAPEGAQVLFLQGTGSASRTLNFTAGYYIFSFFAAQRGNTPSTQRVELRIDGVAIQGFTPAGAAYQRFSSGAVLLSSGPHSIELRGLNPQGGDNSALVDDLGATRVRELGISGFESPAIPTSPGYAYAPSGGSWTFNGLSGLSRNASGFTVANPAAPEGSQVLFLQGASTASTTVTIPRSGYYRFRFKAALRANDPVQPSAKNVRITIGGTQVGEFRLASIQYLEQISAAIYLDAGASTVSLTGVDTAPGDHTGLVDDLRMEMLLDWQDPYVWGGALPGANDDATVIAGSAVCLQGILAPKSITVSGELLGVQNRNVAVTTQYVMVMGSGSLLELGQELRPIQAPPSSPSTPRRPIPKSWGWATSSSAPWALAPSTSTAWSGQLDELGANVSAAGSSSVVLEKSPWTGGRATAS